MPSPKQSNSESSRQGAAQLSRYAAVSSRLEYEEHHEDKIHVDQGMKRPGILINSPPIAPEVFQQGTSRLLPDQLTSPEAGPISIQPSQSDSMFLVEPLRESDLQLSYAQELTDDSNAYDHYGKAIEAFGSLFGFLGSIPGCICFPNQYQQVAQGSVGLISRFGRYYKAVDPGLIKINPMTEQLTRVDVKLQALEIHRRPMTTRDKVTIEVDCVLFWKVINPYKAAFAVDDVRNALSYLAQTYLRTVIGSRNLETMISDRELMAAEIEEKLETTSKWGIEIDSVLIKDLILSKDIEDSLSQTFHRRLLEEAKIMAIEAEVRSAEFLREAGDILSSPAAMHLRELEAYQVMASDPSTKLVILTSSFRDASSTTGHETSADFHSMLQSEMVQPLIVTEKLEKAENKEPSPASQGSV